MPSTTFVSASDLPRPNMATLTRAFTLIGKRAGRKSDADDDDLTSMSPNPHAIIGRAASQRGHHRGPVRAGDISSPLALVSTSNMQVHNAKHIAGASVIAIHQVGNDPAPAAPASHSSNSSVSGGDESDGATLMSSTHDEEGASYTDASSLADETPVSTPSSPLPPNHLSCYFKPAVDTSSPPTSTSPRLRSRSSTSSSVAGGNPYAPVSPLSPTLSSFPEVAAEGTTSNAESWLPSPANSDNETPRLPQRVPSHSKRAHERVHRTRSLQRTFSVASSSGSASGIASASPGVVGRRSPLRRSASVRGSGVAASAEETSVKGATGSLLEGLALDAAPGNAAGPFGMELAQLEEVAEEFSPRSASQEVEVEAEAEGERFAGSDDSEEEWLEEERRVLAEKGFALLGVEVYMREIAGLEGERFGAFDEGVSWL